MVDKADMNSAIKRTLVLYLLFRFVKTAGILGNAFFCIKIYFVAAIFCYFTSLQKGMQHINQLIP